MKEATPTQRLGDAIRQRRLALGVSQDAFADVIGMHRAYYSAIERGERNVTLQTMQRVSEGLKVSLAKLMAAADL